MNELNRTEVDAIILELCNQRNTALNALASVRGEVAVLRERIKELEQPKPETE